jgi:hypothetical protein
MNGDLFVSSLFLIPLAIVVMIDIFLAHLLVLTLRNRA